MLRPMGLTQSGKEEVDRGNRSQADPGFTAIIAPEGENKPWQWKRQFPELLGAVHRHEVAPQHVGQRSAWGEDGAVIPAGVVDGGSVHPVPSIFPLRQK